MTNDNTNKLEKKLRAAFVTLFSILALVLAGTAYACEQPVFHDTFVVCYDGETITLNNINRSILASYLSENEGATLGECEAPPVVVVEDGGPAHTYLCGSWLYKGTTPSVQLLSDAADLIASGKYRIPIAITVAEADKQGIPAWARNPVGNDILACDRDGLKGTGTGYNGAGGNVDFYGTAAWKVLIHDVASPYNRYEKWS